MHVEFENVGLKRLTKKGSRPTQTMELDVPNLEPGQGRILESGEIVIHDPKAGLMALRADRVHVYIPKTKARNPLDVIVENHGDEGEEGEGDDSGQSEPTQAEAAAPESAESDEAEAAGDTPLIGPDALSGGDKPRGKELGQATGGSGYGGIGKF